MSAEEISLFVALEENPSIKSRSSLAWQETAENTWRITADSVEYVIGRNSLNRYIFTRNGEVIAAEGDPTTAFTLADAWLRTRHGDAVKNLLENSVQWRAEKATDAQIKLIKRMSKGQEIPPNLTKGAAGRLISSKKRRYT
jgi:hypothetical protein